MSELPKEELEEWIGKKARYTKWFFDKELAREVNKAKIGNSVKERYLRHLKKTREKNKKK